MTPRADFGKEQMTVEHILPQSAGGTHRWDNLAGAHIGCNQQRSSRPILAFLLFRHAMGLIRGQKGTAVRVARQQMRNQFHRTGSLKPFKA